MAKRKADAAGAGKPEEDPPASISEYLFGGTMLLFAAVMPWYFELPLIFDVTSRDFNPLIFVPVIFAAIGVYSLVVATRTTMRGKKFGNASLSPLGARTGELFRPTMRTDTDIEATGDFVLMLKCVRTTRSGDDFEGHTNQKVVWKQSETCPASTRSSHGVSATFRIPKDAQKSRTSGKGADTSSISWVLTVTAPVRGVNFYAAFPISVR